MPRPHHIIVTVSDEALDSIQTVATELAAKGMQVDRVLPVTGIIGGSCPLAVEAVLRTVRGVQSVEEEAEVQISPPDSPVQ